MIASLEDGVGFGVTDILLGTWMGSSHLLQAVSREYSQLDVQRSIAALVPGFLIARAAIALGIPISFNNIIISSVIGSGLVMGSTGVSGRRIGVTVAAWLATLVFGRRRLRVPPSAYDRDGCVARSARRNRGPSLRPPRRK